LFSYVFGLFFYFPAFGVFVPVSFVKGNFVDELSVSDSYQDIFIFTE
jgi:hypothetical protein